jgi:hypothetical protein
MALVLLGLLFLLVESIKNERVVTWINNQETVSLTIAFTALLVSIIALVYTLRTFWLKSGESVRFTYSTSSHVDTEDNYIHSITIENLKDKPIVIFNIYLKIGNNNYLELEEFKDTPLIIKPFEVFQKKYDPILFYSRSLDRIKIDHLLNDRKIKKSLVLSTTNGKYEVKSDIKRWYLVTDLFKNHFTSIIRPNWLTYKDKAYGKNIKFLVELTFESGNEQVIAVNQNDYNRRRFKGFNLTKDSLESTETLKKYIEKQKALGNISFERINVMAFHKEVDSHEVLETGDEVEAVNLSKIYYHIFGRVFTIYREYLLKKKNKKNKDMNG